MISPMLDSRVIAPLATLLTENGEVDEIAMLRQISSLQGRAEAVMPAIGCGEGHQLSNEQWKHLLHTTLRFSQNFPVYMGVQATNWEVVGERIQTAVSAHVDGVVVGLPPDDNTPVDEVLIRLRKFALDFPTTYFFYWESFLSKRKVSASVVASWCGALAASGVKDSMRNPEETRRLHSLQQSIRIFEGWEDMLLPNRNLDGYIGPLALLSDTPLATFRRNSDWTLNADEADSMGLLASSYVKNVKRVLLRRGIARTSLLVNEVAT